MSHHGTEKTFTLERTPFGRIVLVDPDGTRHEGVVPVRAFALSAPDEGIALMSAESKELRWIPKLADLPEALRKLIAEELAKREFMPVIGRIVGVSSFATPSTWTVDTDRGQTTLTLKSEEDIRRLRGTMGSGALMIADSQGIHFLIRDRMALDAQSQRILKRFM
jgi:hypothetical protein